MIVNMMNRIFVFSYHLQFRVICFAVLLHHQAVKLIQKYTRTLVLPTEKHTYVATVFQ
jgi:hypothetical protein